MTLHDNTNVFEVLRDQTPGDVLDAFGTVPDLHQIAERIRDRDRLAEKYAHAQWLENGRDLLKVKAILSHGDFGEWCRRELSYSARTAQKLMRAAEVCGSYFKNESGSHLPKPARIYELSAPSVPQEIRDVYIPRLLAGEVVGDEARAAIKQHRAGMREARRRATQSAEIETDRKEEAAEAARQADQEDWSRIGSIGQVRARSTALDILAARLGNDLPVLMALVAEAGPEEVFSLTAERELHARVHSLGSLPAKLEDGSGAGGETELFGGQAADVEASTEAPTVIAAAVEPASRPGLGIAPELAEQHPVEPFIADTAPLEAHLRAPAASGESGNISPSVNSCASGRQPLKLKYSGPFHQRVRVRRPVGPNCR